MEEEQNKNNQIPEGRIYTNRAIHGGTFLGGPLVAGYLMAENFKVFGEPGKAQKAWLYSIIGTIVIFGSALFIRQIDKVPKELIPLIYLAIAAAFVRAFQKTKIEAHINAGGQIYRWWRTLIVALIGFVFTFGSLFLIVLFSVPSLNADNTIKTYGVMKHEIGFDKNNITVAEVDKIAVSFTNAGYFNEKIKKYVFVTKDGSQYDIFISCNALVKDNQPAFNKYAQIRNDMQAMFPDHKIVFNLVVDKMDNVVKRIE